MEENKNIIPIPRELDGIYYRVERDGKWCNRCFTDLTTDEQEEMIKKAQQLSTSTAGILHRWQEKADWTLLLAGKKRFRGLFRY